MTPIRLHRRAGVAARVAVLACALASLSLPARAVDLSGTRTVLLHGQDGQAVKIATVDFRPRVDGRTAFTLAMDRERFKDFFLSMKEFKCLEGPGEVMCHVPYPYPQPGTIVPGDLAWLEHSLLFLFKKPGEFGAKLWNGLYFRLSPTAQGFEGTPQAIDLNLISAPPAQPLVPPYRPALRDDLAPDARWFHRLTIE